MSWTVSLLGDGFWTKIKDFFTGIFAIIPQFIYFFYTCIASVLDTLQYLIRKLAGLDVYYINGVETNGDILSELINGVLGVNGKYSALNTVFWSMMIFGVIILILGVIISLIKTHYNYDETKSRPSFIIGKALKNVALMAIVPIVSIFGVYIANIFLKALDSITSSSSVGTTAEVFETSEGNYQTVFEAREDEWGSVTYVSYDFFGSDAPTGTATISGILFKAAANSCNRVRYGGYTASEGGASLSPTDGKWSNCGIFSSNLSSPDEQKEAVAYMIDYAFANNLRLSDNQTASILKEESLTLVSSFRYWQSAVWYIGTIEFKSFSKYNVGLVWYYYNLWQFNFLVGFIGVILALIFITSIVFGLMGRLLECTALMVCLGPIIGMGPLDDGAAFGTWKKTFVSDVLTAYGAIGGMNLSFMLLPHLQNIMFFTSPLLNAIMDMILIIVMLIAVKQIVSLISGFVGGGDAASIGSSLKGEVANSAKQGADDAAKAASLAVKVMKLIPATKAAAAAMEKAAKKVKELKKKTLDRIKNMKAVQALKNSSLGKGLKNANEKLKKWKNGKEEDFKDWAYGEGDDITEEEHDKLVEKEKNDLNKEKAENEENIENNKKEKAANEEQIEENDEEIEKVDGAKDRTADENRAEAARLEEEADDLEEEREDFREDFDKFMASSGGDFNDYLKRSGKTKVSKSLSGKINAQKNLYKAHKLTKDKAFDNVSYDVDKEKGFFASFNKAAENRAAASALRGAADLQDQNQALRDRNAEIDNNNSNLSDRNTEIDARLEEMNKEGFTLEGKRIVKHKILPDGFGEMVADFNGETFKAVNATLGLDEAFKNLGKNTDIIDSGKIILKDFAQELGVSLNGIKAFDTKKQAEERKKNDKQGKQTVNDGVEESKQMLTEIENLKKAFKDSGLTD